jgi:hypothetical protein
MPTIRETPSATRFQFSRPPFARPARGQIRIVPHPPRAR